ncbi:HYOU1 [Lepeophtheirus salmonis]|uniref:Hypoxia up-regulated protein 1 n=1 Tax=Lepeophtheirus salmonis TaxID=72036 RepID=A0A7R8H8U9_LEPSM|nr:HYOU1 [Lepeophtheirus salmonis]CAF2944721.1 HYOU1 [Lepeophtheirus salmonis]
MKKVEGNNEPIRDRQVKNVLMMTSSQIDIYYYSSTGILSTNNYLSWSSFKSDVDMCVSLFLASIPLSHSAAVMSVDLGSEWFKVAVVSPGVPMEIALNVESKRKTATTVSFRDGERAFGSEALQNCVKYPKTCYVYFIDLLAKSIDHPVVQNFKEKFPYYDLEEDPSTGGVRFKHAENEYYTPEELLSMILTHARTERRSVLRASKMANLDCLQLISESIAVALNYGMFPFQMMKTKERGFSETHPMAQILGVAYDRDLGGLDLQLKLRDLLGQKFNDLKKKAGRVKNVLSANSKLYAQVENVMEDIDLKVPISREEVFDDALKNAGGMKMEEISEVILVGAGTRIPKLQEVLAERVGFELSKNLNTDEAAAMGAVYKAADLSNGFKVKKFITKESVIFPIDVDFKRHFVDDDDKPQVKQVRRSLFGRSNNYPQKKIMTFNKFSDDFVFNVNLNDVAYLGEIEVRVLNQHWKIIQEKNIESKGVKAHFILNESGFITVSAIEAVFEQTISVEEQEAEEKNKLKESGAGGSKNDSDTEASDTWSKIGDTFSSLFGEKSKAEEKDEESSGDKKDDSIKEENGGSKKNGTKKEKVKEPKKPKIVIIKEPLEFEVVILNGAHPSEEAVNESIAKLRALDKKDDEKRERENAQNTLESFVIDMKDKLYQELYEKSSTEEEREKISNKLSEVSDWIDEEVGPYTETKLMQSKLTELHELTSSLFARVREHTERPEAFEVLRNNELDNFEKKISETLEWRDHVEKELSEQPMHEMPKTTVFMIAEKASELDREVKYLPEEGSGDVDKSDDVKAETYQPDKETKTDEDVKETENEGKKVLEDIQIEPEEENKDDVDIEPEEENKEDIDIELEEENEDEESSEKETVKKESLLVVSQRKRKSCDLLMINFCPFAFLS